MQTLAWVGRVSPPVSAFDGRVRELGIAGVTNHAVVCRGRLSVVARPVSVRGSATPPAGRQAGSAALIAHCLGPVSCTLVPSALTATVTGMSFTSNS